MVVLSPVTHLTLSLVEMLFLLGPRILHRLNLALEVGLEARSVVRDAVPVLRIPFNRFLLPLLDQLQIPLVTPDQPAKDSLGHFHRLGILSPRVQDLVPNIGDSRLTLFVELLMVGALIDHVINATLLALSTPHFERF